MTNFQRFITLGEIEIAVDPVSNLRRLAILEGGQNWHPVLKQAGLQYMVHFLDEQGNRLTGERFRPYRWPLVADDITKVDAQFNVVQHPGPIPAERRNGNDEIINQGELEEYASALQTYNSLKSEYQAILDAVIAGANILELQYNMTMLRSSQGKANK